MGEVAIDEQNVGQLAARQPPAQGEPINPPCWGDSRQRAKAMLPLRFFQESCREAMQPREEKAIGLTAADWVRMCRATYSRGLRPPDDIPQKEKERRRADRSR